MDAGKTIEIAMINENVDGIMKLVDLSGLSYDIVSRAIKGDGSVKIRHFVTIMNKLGYRIKAEKIKV